jgi:hypothetical protein
MYIELVLIKYRKYSMLRLFIYIYKMENLFFIKYVGRNVDPVFENHKLNQKYVSKSTKR